VARALIVGCGCRGRELGVGLRRDGWEVRGTTRDASAAPAIEAAGIEAAVADPLEVGTVFELIEGVTLVFWLLGSAAGRPGELEAIHGPRLERLLERLVDTPVRGVVYEGAGTVPAAFMDAGARLVREATARWRIPAAVTEVEPEDLERWREEMLAAARHVPFAG